MVKRKDVLAVPNLCVVCGRKSCKVETHKTQALAFDLGDKRD